MSASNNIYQSILQKLSEISVEKLPQIDNYLDLLSNQGKAKNVSKIMALAGTWNEMSDEDFNEYRQMAKSTEIFCDNVVL